MLCGSLSQQHAGERGNAGLVVRLVETNIANKRAARHDGQPMIFIEQERQAIVENLALGFLQREFFRRSFVFILLVLPLSPLLLVSPSPLLPLSPSNLFRT